MQEELERYSTRLRESGNLPIEARVGANTGEVVMRSIATGEGHTEYTPIGHTANLASRMQALAPTDSIAISEQTRRLLFGDSDGISTEIKTRWRSGWDSNWWYRLVTPRDGLLTVY